MIAIAIAAPAFLIMVASTSSTSVIVSHFVCLVFDAQRETVRWRLATQTGLLDLGRFHIVRFCQRDDSKLDSG